MLAEDLRKSVLQAAMRGALDTQRDSDEPVEILFKRMQEDKKQLIINKRIKTSNNTSDITEDEIPYELPDNWKWVRLCDICELLNGRAYKKHELLDEGKTPVIRVGNFFTNQKIYYSDLKLEDDKYCEKGDLLYAWSASFGPKIWDGVRSIYHYHIWKLVLFGNVDKKYVYYSLLNDVNKIKESTTGSTMIHISKENMNPRLFALPPIEEQKRIVEKIEEVMKEIDKYEKVEKELFALKQAFPGDLKKSLLQAAIQGRLVEQHDSDGDVDELIDAINRERAYLIKEKVLKKSKALEPITEEEIPFDVPDSWKWMRLNDIGEIFNGNSINAQVKKTQYEGLRIGYPYIATKDIKDNGIDYENGVKIPYETTFKIARKGSTLVCSEGGSAGKKVGIVEQDVCFGNKLFVIQQFKPILLNEFIYYFTLSPLFKIQFNSMLTGIIGGVSTNNFKKILIPIPPLKEQKRIVEKLDQLLPLCDELI